MNDAEKFFRAMVAVATVVSASAHAQADESATVPDLSGIWLLDGRTTSFSDAAPPTMTKWAQERFTMNVPTVGPRASIDANDPTLRCLPPGVPYVLTIPTPFEIVQLDDRILQLFEYDHSVRRIHTDERTWPEDLQPLGMYQWMGYSIGHWEGNTLVVETRGFNDDSWLDRSGHPHSEALVVRERFWLPDPDTLVDEVTVHDPAAFAQPWTGRMTFKRRTGWELYEHICISEDATSDDYLEYRNRAWEPPAASP